MRTVTNVIGSNRAIAVGDCQLRVIEVSRVPKRGVAEATAGKLTTT